MKRNKIKLRWQIFAYVLIFAGLVIFTFCFFQILMLDYFYKQNKINSAGDLVDQVIECLDNPNADELISYIAREEETSVYFITSDKNLSMLNRTYSVQTEYYQRLVENIDFINRQKTNGKFYVTFQSKLPNPYGEGPLIDKSNITLSNDSDIICCRFVTINNVRYLLAIDSRLTPIQPVVETLEQQLVVISIIVIILSIGVAFFISNNISKPIKEMTNDANLLASGRRDIVFNGNGFEEIIDLNNALNYAVNELNKTDTLQKELLANISHDLKTPLTLISGYAEMMRDIPSEVNEDNLQLIVDETSRLNVLVNDLLNLSKLQAKTATFEMVEFDLNKLIKDIVDRENKFNESKGIQIEFNCDNSLFINGDIHKMEQVIYNFVTNAINYSGESKIVKIYEDVIDNKTRIIFEDFGLGIKEEDLPYIWNRYYRTDKGHQRSIKGTGLGLAIVKEILEYHNFNYGVDSIYGKGSKFYFEIINQYNEGEKK